MEPYLSVIVPIYKVEKYLKQCIDSILKQTFTDFELILVDDGSPDNCPAICDEYADKYKKVKVIHKLNGGLVSARKAGLEAARGKFIGFVDSDDWIEPNMFELLCEKSKSHRVDIVICDILHEYPNSTVKHNQNIKHGLYDKESLIKNIFPIMLYSGVFYEFGIFPTLCNKIIKREILEKNLKNIDNTIKMGEDAACTYPSLLDADSVYILENKYLYHYRQIPSSMTNAYDPKYLDRVLVLYKLLNNTSNYKGVFDLSNQLYYYMMYLIIGAVRNEYNNSNNKSYYKKRLFLKKMLEIEDVKMALTSVITKGFPLRSKVYITFLQKKWITPLFLIITLFRLRPRR